MEVGGPFEPPFLQSVAEFPPGPERVLLDERVRGHVERQDALDARGGGGIAGRPAPRRRSQREIRVLERERGEAVEPESFAVRDARAVVVDLAQVHGALGQAVGGEGAAPVRAGAGRRPRGETRAAPWGCIVGTANGWCVPVVSAARKYGRPPPRSASISVRTRSSRAPSATPSPMRGALRGNAASSISSSRPLRAMKRPSREWLRSRICPITIRVR